MTLTLEDWWPWYNRILKVFGYDQSRDQYAADLLSALLAEKAVDIAQLERLVSGRPVLVFGAGPSLEENLRQVMSGELLQRCVSITANGATTALLQISHVTPNVVVTDLDGTIRDLLAADKQGALTVIHGHGDNIEQLKTYVPRFSKALGTTQVQPRPNVYNFFGFTDGDRAVFLAVAMGAKLIALAGMDLGVTIGKYSKKMVSSLEVKRRKLRICKELLEWLASKVDLEFFNITQHGEKIKGFKDITAKELRKIISKK